MNRLLVLSLLQIALLASVLYVLLAADQADQAQGSGQFYISDQAPTAAERPDSVPAFVDGEMIRQIVRSELADFSDRLIANPQASQPGFSEYGSLTAGEPADPGDPRIVQARDRIAAYLSAGEVSDRDITELQNSIAGLDSASQKAVLGELFREINAGNIRFRP